MVPPKLASSAYDARHSATPPDPDSWGIVSAIRSSNAPTISAPLPLREQPVIATRLGSIFAAGVASSASITRLTPQAQAISAPTDLSPFTSKKKPVPRLPDWFPILL